MTPQQEKDLRELVGQALTALPGIFLGALQGIRQGFELFAEVEKAITERALVTGQKFHDLVPEFKAQLGDNDPRDVLNAWKAETARILRGGL